MKAILVALVLLATGCTSSEPDAEPSVVAPVAVDANRAPMTPIHGRPLTGPTGLRFVVHQEKGAVLLDIDRGTATPVAGGPVVLNKPSPLVADDEPTRHVRFEGQRLDLPSSPGEFSDGVASPDGRWIVARMGNPAWPGPRQLLDLWLLDTRTLRWHHVPSMPTPVSLKETNLAWTSDNRLVLLGRFDRTPDIGIDQTKDVLALFRPGAPDLLIRQVRLPAQGTPAFTVVP